VLLGDVFEGDLLVSRSASSVPQLLMFIQDTVVIFGRFDYLEQYWLVFRIDPRERDIEATGGGEVSSWLVSRVRVQKRCLSDVGTFEKW
jgi:hypothetical protein